MTAPHRRRVVISAGPLVLVGLGVLLTMSGSAAGLSAVHNLSGLLDAVVHGAAAGGALGADLVAGDLDGDGIADLVVNAPWSACPSDRAAAGAVHVIFGRPEWPPATDLRSQADVTICGADANDALGSGVRHAAGSLAIGDVNGDGRNDLVIAAAEADGLADGRANAGQVYVLFGRPEWDSAIDLVEPFQGILLYGGQAGDFFGTSVDVGDLDGDGRADIAVGAMNADPSPERRQAGLVYVWYGRDSFAPVIDVAGDGADLVVRGRNRSDGLGAQVVVGDLDGDGRDDLVMGAPFAGHADRSRNGALYGLFSPDIRRTGVVDLAAQPPDWLAFGEFDGDLIGQHLAVEDVTGDGEPDVLVGAPAVQVTVDRRSAGKVYVLFGPASASQERDLRTDSDVVIFGAREEDFLGDVAAGDVDADGVADVLLGARQADRGGNPGQNQGAVYILSVDDITSPYDLAVGGDHVTIAGADAGDLLSRVTVGNLDGQGAVDLAAGAPGADGPPGDARDGSGEVLVVGGAAPTPTATVVATASPTPTVRASPTVTATPVGSGWRAIYLPLVGRNSTGR